jgi:hypothetical protein
MMNTPRGSLPRMWSIAAHASGGMDIDRVTVFRPRVEPGLRPAFWRLPPWVGLLIVACGMPGMEPGGVIVHIASIPSP